MALTFIASPLHVLPRNHRAHSDRAHRRAPVLLAKRPSSKRPASRGFGPAPPADERKPVEQKAAEPLRDLTPAPPTLRDAPDAATLRAGFAKRGIKPPPDSSADSASVDGVRTADDDDAGTLPEVVAARMGRRMIIFGGVPVTLLFAFFAAYFVLTYRFEIRVIPGVVAYSTLALIGAAGLGITYGIFSSSWDVEDEGSRFGFDEARVNFFRTRDALAGASRREKQDEQFEEFDRIVQKTDAEEE